MEQTMECSKVQTHTRRQTHIHTQAHTHTHTARLIVRATSVACWNTKIYRCPLGTHLLSKSPLGWVWGWGVVALHFIVQAGRTCGSFVTSRALLCKPATSR